MDKFKTYTTLLSIVSVILLLLLVFSAKKTVYVCYDGTEQKVESKCPSVPPLTITQKSADEAIRTYVTAYAVAKGDRPSVVSTIRLNNTYRSDVLFYKANANEVYNVSFNIDGKTSYITCLGGCEYLQNSKCCECQDSVNATN